MDATRISIAVNHVSCKQKSVFVPFTLLLSAWVRACMHRILQCAFKNLSIFRCDRFFLLLLYIRNRKCMTYAYFLTVKLYSMLQLIFYRWRKKNARQNWFSNDSIELKILLSIRTGNEIHLRCKHVFKFKYKQGNV